MSNNLLQNINIPKDLRRLEINQLPQVAQELRDFIINVVSKNEGHLGASLGVVELTIALHYVFDTPEDLLVWDVGHQAYGHKILTGRRENFHTNRKLGGISGFPNRLESVYDAFGQRIAQFTPLEQNAGENTLRLDTSALPHGAYQIMIMTANGISKTKVMITR